MIRHHFLLTPQTIGWSGNVISSSTILHLGYRENLKSAKLTLYYTAVVKKPWWRNQRHFSINQYWGDRKKYDSVLAKFDSFFSVRKNVIIEHTKFNKRSQLPDEPVEQFITSLYSLAADCNFGELKDKLIRDRIVVRIRDASLSERL